MDNLFGLMQKLMMATILGWLGLQFAPSDSDESDKREPNARGAIVSLIN